MRFLVFILLIFISCEKDSTSSEKNQSSKFVKLTEGATSLEFSDNGDHNDARDFKISFKGAEDEDQVTEYRIIIRQYDLEIPFDMNTVLNLPQDRFVKLDISLVSNTYHYIFNDNAKDHLGDLIKANTFYQLVVLSITDKSIHQQDFIAYSDSPIELTNFAETPSNILADDLSNNRDASDLYVTFTKAANDEFIQNYRAYIVKTSKLEKYQTRSDFFNLSLNVSYDIDKDGKEITYQFPANALDVDGELVTESNEYALFIASIVSEGSPLTNSINLNYSTFKLNLNNYIVSEIDSLNINSGSLAIDINDNFYISDKGQNDVYKIDTDIGMISFSTNFSDPTGISFNSKKQLYISDFGNNSVFFSSEDGDEKFLAISSNEGLINPMGIFIDANDTVYVVSQGNRSILKFTNKNNVAVYYTNQNNLLEKPIGITQDLVGNLYVTNETNGNIIKITKEKTASIFATINSKGIGYIKYGNNALYVSSKIVNSIFEITLDGNVKTLAGTGLKGHYNGSALKSTLSNPGDIALSKDGKALYFIDVINPANNESSKPIRLRKVILDIQN